MSIPAKKIFATPNETEGKLPPVPNRSESFASFLQRIMAEKHLTYQGITAASGGQISANYVHDLANGKITGRRLAGDKIVALAKGINESPLAVFCASQGLALKLKDNELQNVLEGYEALPKEDQMEFRFMIEMLGKAIYERRSKMR